MIKRHSFPQLLCPCSNIFSIRSCLKKMDFLSSFLFCVIILHNITHCYPPAHEQWKTNAMDLLVDTSSATNSCHTFSKNVLYVFRHAKYYKLNGQLNKGNIFPPKIPLRDPALNPIIWNGLFWLVEISWNCSSPSTTYPQKGRFPNTVTHGWRNASDFIGIRWMPRRWRKLPRSWLQLCGMNLY